MMDGDEHVIQGFEESLNSPFEGDDQYNEFMLKELEESVPGFATTQTTPRSAHARQQLTSPSISPPEHKALIPATPRRRLVFDRNDKKAFLQNVKVVTEKRDTCTYDLRPPVAAIPMFSSCCVTIQEHQTV
jgi:hypothetical protein